MVSNTKSLTLRASHPLISRNPGRNLPYPTARSSGDHSAVEPPVPFPNTEVKRCSPNDSASIGCAKVGRCQYPRPAQVTIPERGGSVLYPNHPPKDLHQKGGKPPPNVETISEPVFAFEARAKLAVEMGSTGYPGHARHRNSSPLSSSRPCDEVNR